MYNSLFMLNVKSEEGLANVVQLTILFQPILVLIDEYLLPNSGELNCFVVFHGGEYD